MQLAEALPDIDLTVVTNDFGVLTVLSPKTRINLVMLGGELRLEVLDVQALSLPAVPPAADHPQARTE